MNSFIFTISCIIILFILQSYYSKLNNLKSNTPDNAIPNDGNDTTLFEQKIIIDNNHDDDNDDEFNNLFEKIKNVVEKDKLFLDNELSINNIAKKINTNISYISKAINIKTGENFNNFINQYRIHYFKELLKKKDNDSYKLKYLYSESGFKNQSTFNKAFKKIENKTPSEYIKMYFDRDVAFD
ncbi:helix-turn-helix domain-containing protein [Flavobacterium branchiophilum]|uniref:helix-turn-helix domain-containing protein n=1 Tax=Flavobacterium branchiophilum TaxID=55197 RepID=UPI00130540CB|nr:AraC family transcriptional regulator [Flavobacterium branchiophilum]